MVNKEDLIRFNELSKDIFNEIKKDIIGQEEVVNASVIAMIAGGNILLEGVPGVGKTRLVRTIARVFNMPFSRIQFTPDLMPADITGTNMIIKDKDNNSKFEFNKGPIFSNIILADEINRATPKTQSALLEAMQEKTVTVMGKSHVLPIPFFVLATQNPVEQDGTYPLPEAQMDRFMFKIIVNNPNFNELRDIVNLTQKTMDEVSNPICSKDDLLLMRKVSSEILVADDVMEYALKLILATHPESEYEAEFAKRYITLGASPRAAQALISAAKVKALLDGRFNISYDDIDYLAYPILRHRIKLNFEAISENLSSDVIIEEIIKEISKKEKNNKNVKSLFK